MSILLLMVIAKGLASRRSSWLASTILGHYPGDACWAVAAYLGLILIFPKASFVHAAIGAMAISFAVEISQLYHAAWIDSIRRTTFGRLLLGSGFDLIDLAAYFVGTILASITDLLILKRNRHATERIGK